MNPIPYTAMAANGLGWITYGIVIHDFFVYGSNVSGLLLGLFYVMTCYKYANNKASNSQYSSASCSMFTKAAAAAESSVAIAGTMAANFW